MQVIEEQVGLVPEKRAVARRSDSYEGELYGAPAGLPEEHELDVLREVLEEEGRPSSISGFRRGKARDPGGCGNVVSPP